MFIDALRVLIIGTLDHRVPLSSHLLPGHCVQTPVKRDLPENLKSANLPEAQALEQSLRASIVEADLRPEALHRLRELRTAHSHAVPPLLGWPEHTNGRILTTVGSQP